MKIIVVASQNPVKLRAAQRGFERMFPDEKFGVTGLQVPSGVGRQPRSYRETLKGARQRATRAAGEAPQADFLVGIEGGVEEQAGEMAAFAWIVVLGRGREGKSRTGTFFLPDEVAGLVRAGMELGEADDAVFNRSNSKQDSGAIGLLTGDVIDRQQLYEHAVVLALVPFKNPDLYPSP